MRKVPQSQQRYAKEISHITDIQEQRRKLKEHVIGRQ